MFYYIDPNTLITNGKVTVKSDVYAFAIITLQILTESLHIYENEDDLENLINEIKNGLLPMVPTNFPEDLRKLIFSCLNLDSTLRPPFSRICTTLDKIIEKMPNININIFLEYKEKIKSMKEEEEMSPNVLKMKEIADQGDAEMMYLYAMKRLEGKDCKSDQTEAARYLQMAKKKGHDAAKAQLKYLKNQEGTIANSFSCESLDAPQQPENNINIQVNQQPEELNYETIDNVDNNDEFISLVDDTSFDKPEYTIESLLQKIDEQINSKELFNFQKKEIEEQNFIFSKGAEERLQKLIDYLRVGVPVLLEGPTGTSKTLSSEIVCKLLGLDLIRFNLSSETKTQDLIGRYVGNDKSWAGISQQDGPFYQAFTKGYVLLLDEINLASASVLQCIEEALDSGVLSIEIPGRPLKSIIVHPNFRVIATQNPNKGSYAHKRQNLGLKFYSRFQVINFPAFTEEELLYIGEGLAKRFGYKDLNVVKEIIMFHKDWSENPAIADDPQCFTIREIAATVKALSKGESVYDTIMTIYGARYQNDIKSKLTKLIKDKYPSLITKSDPFLLPSFNGCYPNQSLEIAVKSALFSLLKNGRNVILTGKEGCGKTQVALWISEYYNSLVQTNSEEKKSFFCVCTEEIKVADLVGHQAPSGKSDGTSELIKWQDGFLTEAIKLGMCSVLESLDESPATVTERLNGLLDQKYDNQERYFDIPENSANPRVLIKETFRILATANIENISQMSPAFLNRFDIIVLENQIEDNINENQFMNLLSVILDKYCTELSSKTQEELPQITKIDEKKLDSDYYSDSDSDSDSDCGFIFISKAKKDDTKEQAEIKSPAKEIKKEEAKYKYSDTIKSMIYEKIKNEKSISRISKICSAVIKLGNAFQSNKKITDKEIVEFAFNLLQNNNQFEIPKEIRENLLKTFQKIRDNTDDPFFYEESPSLCSFLAKLAAYSIIEQPVCVTGPTGAGKTSAARAFARMRPRKSSYKSGFQMHSFHSGTKVSHFFGSTTLLDGEIVFHDGTLTKALKLGLVFIADEFNLSTQSVMKSLSLALDPAIGKDVFIPGIGQIINISPEFHFIACQNEIGTLGRNAIPDSISQRFVYVEYPKPNNEDIQKICINIAKECLPEDHRFEDEDEEHAQLIANYMIRLNEYKSIYIPQWSLRDITKLFRRIYSQNKQKIFKNFTYLHHVLFYTMSPVSSNDINNVIEKVRATMKLSFYLGDDEVNEYIDCYKSEPKIEGLFLMKGNSGISIKQMEQTIIKNELPSLWNSIFQVYLADDKEPILLMGNSGYKTFLAQLFLPKAQIITLNQETNVASLLGSSGFMTNSEAKLFYIDYICKIIQNDSKIIELRNDWGNGNLDPNKINKLIEDGKRDTIPYSFHYALDHLAQKLLENQDNNNKDSVLSNTTLEFRPGLFLNSILQGQSLILKDLSNLPTIVLERFNELFSGKQNITLSEDIHNTFTPADYKELTNFNDSFNVYATCPANSPSRLSEAVLSRFTVISVSEYTSEEQEIVLKSYIQTNNLLFDPSDIELIIDKFALDYSYNLKTTFTFPQMIKVIEIVSKLNQETSKDVQRLNIGITLYRVLGGIFKSRKKKEKLFERIHDYFEIPNTYKIQRDAKNIKNPFQIINKDNMLGIESNISNLFLQCSTAHECKSQVAFTSTFNDLLDLLHLCLTIHNPIILEGSPGQGKHTAINYITNMLDINVVYIMISQSTKVEDLFGKDTITRQQDEVHVEMIETQFVKIIKSTNTIDKKSLIVLENINNASPALLNALVPVFDTYSTSILLPNGSTIQKGKFDIVGIFNTQQVSSSKDKLPSSLLNSSIYHIVSKPNEIEVLTVILKKFLSNGLTTDESKEFHTNYKNARQILANAGLSSELFTMNDIEKYILFRKLTDGFFDKSTISQMIFAYKFSSEKMNKEMLDKLDLENMIYSPLFSYNISSNVMCIRISKDRDGIHVPLFSIPREKSIISKIDSLTLPQKHCLIFLACSVLSKRSCVIQGDTASGKSYLIRLFAELVGAKLQVFQMNSDSNVSMLAGQSILNDNITLKDQEKFKKAFTDLMVDKKIKKYLEDPSKININDPNSWNPKVLKDLINYIKKIENEINQQKYFSRIEEAVTLIKETMSPVNRFEHKESAFIHAIKYGEWVLIDGIESAPSVIAEKISTLCGERPELNLYEYGPDFCFSKDAKLSKNKIHDNFHIFITFNPNSMKESQMIDQSFLVKSVSFTLPQFDEKIEDSAQMLLGSFVNMKYPSGLSMQLAARFALMHNKAKIESEKNPEKFASDLQYNGRTLKFITKSFENKPIEDENFTKNLSNQICFSTKSFYCNSYIDKNLKDFQKSCIDNFKQKPADKIINYLETGNNDPKKRNEDVLIILRDLQKYLLKKQKECKYTFSNFLNACNKIIISDLPFVQDHIKDTIEKIKKISNKEVSNYLDNTNPLILYGSLLAVCSIFDSIINQKTPIKNEHTFLILEKDELRNNKSISKDLSKFDLLIQLLKNKFISDKSSILLGNKLYSALLQQISLITTNQNKSLLIELFKQIDFDNNLIYFIDKFFPYNKFKNSSIRQIIYWLPLCKKLIQNAIPFSYTIDNIKFSFNKPSSLDYNFDLLMNERDNLSLSEKSSINFDNDGNSMQVPPHESKDNDKNDLIYYSIISKLSDKMIQTVDNEYIHSLLSKSKKLFKKNSILSGSENHSIKLKDLFVQKQYSLISLIWNLVFTLSENEIWDITKIINEIESKLLISTFLMFKSVDQKLINDIILWTEWASELENNTSILTKIVTTGDIDDIDFKEIDKTIENLENEIEYLKRAPEQMKVFWDSEVFIEKCQAKLINLNEIQSEKLNQQKENANKLAIDNFKHDLIACKIPSKYNSMRAELVSKLSIIIDFSDENVSFAKEAVDQFKSLTYSEMKDENSNFIIWPQIIIKNNKSSAQKTENIKLFETLIWYSQINSILNELNNGNDIMKNLWKLNDFDEMKYPRNVLFTNLIKNKYALTLEDKMQAKSTLNSHMIMKLWTLNKAFIEKQQKIYDIINNYMHRKSSDERELQWAYRTVTNLSPSFLMIIPTFEPIDLIYLVINKKAKKDYRNGPLFTRIQNLVFLKDMKNLMKNKYDNFADAAQAIANIVFCTKLAPTEKPPKNYEKLKMAFRSINKFKSEEYEIVKGINTIFSIADSLDKWNDQQYLLFDDLLLLTSNQFDSLEMLNRFPSLTFWIFKYNQCAYQLCHKYNNCQTESNKIPLWLIALRMMSSKDCIEFETNSQTTISKIINEVISSQVKDFLYSKDRKSPINHDWLNIMISNLPPKIINSDIKMIHDFIYVLSNDNQNISSNEIKQMKEFYIKEAISKIIPMLLSNKSQQLVTDVFQNSKSMNQFLAFPSQYIQEKINQSIYSLKNSILTNDSTNQLRNFLSNQIFMLIIDNLQKALVDDQNEMNVYFKEKIQKKNEKKKKEKIKETNALIDKYNKIIYFLINPPIKPNDINDDINELIQCSQKLRAYPELFKNDGIKVRFICYMSLKDKKISIYKSGRKITKPLPKTGNNPKIQYFALDEHFSEDDNKSFIRYNLKYKRETYFQYIRNDIDFTQIISKSSNVIEQPPIILFGNKYQDSDVFVKNLQKLFNLLKTFEDNFFKILEFNPHIPSTIFTFIENTNDMIISIKKNLQVEFSDGKPTERTRKIVLGELKDYLDNLSPLVEKVMNLMKKKLYPIWKALNDNMKFLKLFKYPYDIQIPHLNDKLISNTNFANIKNINSLASPIICVSPDNNLICSVNTLKCYIGPIFPSHITTPYSINIISFIQENITYKIDNLSDPQFETIISTKDKLKSNEPLQIFIMPPHATGDEPEYLTLNGDLVIETESYGNYTLPFEILLGIVPLKVRIRCIDHKIAEKDQLLMLCLDRIDSGSKINFEVINYFVRDHFVLSVELESLDENESEPPKVNIEKMNRGFSLSVPNVNNPTRCQFNIKMAISQNLVTTIKCDFIIIPIVFAFEMYDYLTKKYTSEQCQLMIIPNSKQTLYFRMMSLFPIKKKAQISYYFPKSIQVTSNEKPLNKKFEIDDDFTFSLTIDIDSSSSYIPSYEIYDVKLEVGNITKSVQIKFLDPSSMIFNIYYPLSYEKSNNDYLEKFPCYFYDCDAKDWKKLTENDQIVQLKRDNNPYVIISPFQTFSNYASVNRLDYNYQNYDNVNVSGYGISYLQMTISDDEKSIFNEKTYNNSDKYIKTEYKFIGFQIEYEWLSTSSEIFVYYSIIGYTNDHKYWFPVFDKYPDINSFEFLKYDESETKIANKNIKSMIKELEAYPLKDVINGFTSNEMPIKQKNFAIFIALLSSQSILLNIEKVLNSFPHEIQEGFASILPPILSIINSKDEISENIFTIISHNLILKFAQLFLAKYEEIKSHQFCLQFQISDTEINKQKEKAFNEFMHYDSYKALIKTYNNGYQFAEKDSVLAKLSSIELPEESERRESFIVSENEKLKPSILSDGLGLFKFNEIENEEAENSNTIDSITTLPNIELPKDLSISNLGLFYSICSQGASILPAFIRSNQIRHIDQKSSEIYFTQLLNIYKQSTNETSSNRSIISIPVNSFIESFKNCVRRLKSAGVDFSKTNLPQSCNSSRYSYNQDFIFSPEIEIPILRNIQWKTKHQISENYIKFSDPNYNKSKLTLSENIPTNSIENILQYIHKKEEEEEDMHEQPETKIPEQEPFNNDDIPLIIADICDPNAPQDNSSDDDDILNKPISEQQANQKPRLRVANNDDSQQQIVDHKSVDDLIGQFKESDALERVLRRIAEMKKDGKLKPFSGSECTIGEHQSDLFKTDEKNFPVQKLIENSQHLAAYLICQASESDCPFAYMSCNLLIDCSSFISIENKLYSFMLLISFSYALSALEIPFSIAIVADSKFRFVLKPFEEDISMLVLQRILDCLFIKRYRTSISDTIQYAIKYMKCPFKERTQRSIFLFSNGLDENLMLAESWKEDILNDPNNSFGMIFVKSKVFDDPKYSSIQTMWDDFVNATKTSSISKTRLVYINSDINDDTFKSIITAFGDVMNRPSDIKYQFDSNKTDQKPDFKSKYDELTKSSFENIKNDIEIQFDEDSLSIFRKINQRFEAKASRFPKLDVSCYRNKTEKVTNSVPDKSIKETFDFFIQHSIYSKRNAFRPVLETIFKPNKASQTVLSSTGTDFDITALILNLINPVPDPFIYLEEKGGLIRNYGISIIIDSSYSCFNQISSPHSYQTIKVLFSALSSIDIPCVDVIVATSSAPIILASEIPSLRLFSNKSTFWASLFNCLSQPCTGNCDLESAIHSAFDLRRMRTVDSTSFMFVLTDGLFQKCQRELISNHLMTCIQTGINVFGIGIGIYPKGITDLFAQSIYVTNPNYLINGIASCFCDDFSESFDDKIKPLIPEKCSFDLMLEIFKDLIEDEKRNKVVFKDLKNHLLETQHALDAFSDMYNEEQEARGSNNELINPEGLNTEMYVRDVLKGQKILIVMLYDCKLNLSENPLITPKYLKQAEKAGENECVLNAVEYFGIDIKIVQNYKDAIKDLTKQSKPGYCDYYATWVMSGYPYDTPLPNGGNQYYVDQFIDCLLQFWRNGGSVVMFSEGDPLIFQTNLFLEKIQFPDKSTTQLRIGGNHNGMKYLKGDPTGKLEKPGVFNSSELSFKKYQRAALSHNLVEIYEGETISYAPNDKSQYYPFRPFMRDSENGISALFYPGDENSDPKLHTGDIIIDCGYTKLFDKMTTKGTFRYIQNIAGWTARCESRRIMGINQKEYRPKAVNFTFNENLKYSKLKPLPSDMIQSKSLTFKSSGQPISINNLKRLYAIDHSGSVGGVSLYFNELRSIFSKYPFRSGTDMIMTWGSRANMISYSEMQRIINYMEGDEGTDPSLIASKLSSDRSIPREHLILVTDGQVDSSSIQYSDQILRSNNIQFKYVTSYVIGSGGDLSVGAPFGRGCGMKTIEVLSGSRREIINAEAKDFDVLNSIDQINTVNDFDNYFESIINATIQRTIGTSGDGSLKAQFENLKNRLMKTGNYDAETDRCISVLVDLASGSIQNVFDIDHIVAMKKKKK